MFISLFFFCLFSTFFVTPLIISEKNLFHDGDEQVITYFRRFLFGNRKVGYQIRAAGLPKPEFFHGCHLPSINWGVLHIPEILYCLFPSVPRLRRMTDSQILLNQLQLLPLKESLNFLKI